MSQPPRPLGVALNDAPGSAAYEHGVLKPQAGPWTDVGTVTRNFAGSPMRPSGLLPFLSGMSLALFAGLGLMLALRPASPSHPEDGIARVASAGQLLLPGHTHGDLGLRLAGCGGCAAEFQRGVVSVLSAVQQRAQAAQVGSHGGAR